jgi:hypothetical protein
MNNLSLINPDTIETISVANMPFDETLEVRNSDYHLPENSPEINNESQLRFDNLRILSISEPKISAKLDEDILKKISGNDIFNTREFKKFMDKVGDGKMEYIQDINDKLMMTNAWQAITLTNNWDFVSQEIETFMFSTDPRILQISEKMEELGYSEHSGCSFGFTMRNMQFLVRKGEKEFEKLFDIKNEEEGQKVVINF